MRKRWIALTLGCAAVGGVAGWSIYHTFVKQSRTFIFANWENYMSPGVQNYLADKYDVGFTNYGTNSDLIGLYVDGSYDAAIPSDYLIPQLSQTGALHRFDWSKFSGHGATMLAPEQMAAYYDYDSSQRLVGAYDGGKSLAPVVDNDPINLFNDVVKRQLAQFRSYDGGRFNLLDYGVPYFMQDLIFAYTGEAIPELSDPDKEYSWKDVMAANGHFKNHMKIIDDERNIYSIGQAINTDGTAVPSINPANSSDTDMDPAYQAFGKYAQQVGEVLWDTDSYNVLDYLAKWQDGEPRRASILYNGDAVYGAQGGESKAGEKTSKNLHVVHPTTTVFVLDMVTVSSKTDLGKLPRLLDLVNELALSGTSVDAENADYQQTADRENEPTPWSSYVGNDESEDVYVNLSMQNFNNVNYVSPLRDMSLTASDYYSENDEYEYVEGNVVKTVFYKELYDYAENDVVHMTDASGADLGVAPEDYEGPLLYKKRGSDEKYLEPGFAAIPTGKNIQTDIYTLTAERIVSATIEVPFKDIQQVASIRYFSDMKYKLD